jgi:hypothetical protein
MRSASIRSGHESGGRPDPGADRVRVDPAQLEQGERITLDVTGVSDAGPVTVQLGGQHDRFTEVVHGSLL